MAYTFTTWTACTDPASNSRTLDWSESGMAGQFPGLYLEALRQAALLRHAVVPYSGSVLLSDAVMMQPGIVQAAELCRWIDYLAWDSADAAGSSPGWVLPSHWADVPPPADSPPIWTKLDGDSPMLSEIGDAERIFMTDAAYQFPPLIDQVKWNLLGPWLRQAKKCIAAKTRVRTGAYPGPWTLTDYAPGWALGS